MKKQTKKLPEIDLEKANRKQLMKYTNENVSFYQFVDLTGYSYEQLRRIIERNNE